MPAGDGHHTISLRDQALSVSDPFGPEEDPRATAHIVDPRRGEAVSQPARAVVIGPSARLADAWSTALVVLGRTPRGFPPQLAASIEIHEKAIP